MVLDRATGTYADDSKVRPVNFEGKYFRCCGPLRTVPSPQIVPTLVQAGGSARVRREARRCDRRACGQPYLDEGFL